MFITTGINEPEQYVKCFVLIVIYKSAWISVLTTYIVKKDPKSCHFDIWVG